MPNLSTSEGSREYGWRWHLLDERVGRMIERKAMTVFEGNGVIR
ncbi:MAG: hypothetical protein ABIP82_08720 [Nitrospirales bacterium]